MRLRIRQPFWIWTPVALFASFATGYLLLSIAFNGIARPDGGFLRSLELMLLFGTPMFVVTASYMLFWFWLNRHSEFGLTRIIFGIIAQTIVLILAAPFVVAAVADLLIWLSIPGLECAVRTSDHTLICQAVRRLTGASIFVTVILPVSYLFAIPTAILIGVLLPFFVLKGSYEALLSHRASPKSIPKHHLSRPHW